VKIFVIYASAGQGHKKIAEAIREEAVDSYGENSVKFIDVLDYSTSSYKTFYSKGYLFAISHLSWLWAILFFLSDTKYLKIFNKNLRSFINKIFCNNFLELLKEEKPDVIISTHFLVNELVSYLKGTNQISTRLISVITDFDVHNFWLAENVDIYTVACERTKQILISKNIRKEKIYVLGMPVRKQFQRKIDKKEIRNKLYINEGFTALILTGGIGIGPIEEIVSLLKDYINIIVVCGNNKSLYNKLTSLGHKNLTIFGWIDNIEEAMAASDVAITKPGGSTIVECLALNLPMIFFSIIPGQEARNAFIISDNKLAYIIKQTSQIKEKILFLKDNFDEINKIKELISGFKFKDSAKNILNLINEKT